MVTTTEPGLQVGPSPLLICGGAHLIAPGRFRSPGFHPRLPGPPKAERLPTMLGRCTRQTVRTRWRRRSFESKSATMQRMRLPDSFSSTGIHVAEGDPLCPNLASLLQQCSRSGWPSPDLPRTMSPKRPRAVRRPTSRRRPQGPRRPPRPAPGGSGTGDARAGRQRRPGKRSGQPASRDGRRRPRLGPCPGTGDHPVHRRGHPL